MAYTPEEKKDLDGVFDSMQRLVDCMDRCAKDHGFEVAATAIVELAGSIAGTQKDPALTEVMREQFNDALRFAAGSRPKGEKAVLNG